MANEMTNAKGEVLAVYSVWSGREDALDTELVYDWQEIDRAAAAGGVEPGELRDFAVEAVCETVTGAELLAAYRDALL